MTIKDLREILIHFQERKYDNYKVELWDYENQRELDWGGMYALSHPDKKLTFSVNAKKEEKRGEDKSYRPRG